MNPEMITTKSVISLGKEVLWLDSFGQVILHRWCTSDSLLCCTPLGRRRGGDWFILTTLLARSWLHYRSLWLLNCLVEIITVINDDLSYVLWIDICYGRVSYFKTSAMLVGIGRSRPTSWDGLGAPDFGGPLAEPPTLPPASKEADGGDLLGLLSLTMWSVRPVNREGVRIGAVTSNPLALRPGS